MYLVAMMDWYSRHVVAWQLSNTIDGLFCLDALELALAQGKPNTFNKDQGAQFTALAFTSRLDQPRVGTAGVMAVPAKEVAVRIPVVPPGRLSTSSQSRVLPGPCRLAGRNDSK